MPENKINVPDQSAIKKSGFSGFMSRLYGWMRGSGSKKIDFVNVDIGSNQKISQSMVNDGLYGIAEITDEGITLDGEVYDFPLNTVTKVIYPADVQKGVIDLMIWEKDNRSKVGIKSETLSRHSVTYYDQDTNNQVMGYPVSLLGFLKPYMKPRF